MVTKEFNIEGMTCNHCVMAVRKELSKLDNVKVKDVQIGSAKVEYDDSKVDENLLVHVIEQAGYKVVS